MERCPLCNSELDDGRCPICSAFCGAGGDTDPVKVEPGELERTMRDRKAVAPPEPPRPAEKKPSPTAERASWYAAAGMATPERQAPVREQEPSEPLPEPTRHRDPDSGAVPAAVVLFALAASSLLAMLLTRTPNIFRIVTICCEIGAGVALLKGTPGARFLLLASVGMSLAGSAMVIVLTGSKGFFISLLPPLAVIGALYLESGRHQLIVSAVGVLAAFAWVAVAAFASPPSLEDVKRKFAIQGGVWSEPEMRYSLRAPQGVTLFDRKKIDEKTGKGRGGLLGMVVDGAAAQHATPVRVQFLSDDGNAVGLLFASSLPPNLTIEAVLPTFELLTPSAERDDKLVPEPLRAGPGVESQGWRLATRGGTRHLIVLKAADGRMVALYCDYKVPLAERICGAVFDGLAFSP